MILLLDDAIMLHVLLKISRIYFKFMATMLIYLIFSI